MPDQHEKDLLAYLERMHQEGRAAKEGTDLEDTDQFIKLLRGQQWPDRLPAGFPDFVLNLVNDMVQRKVGLLTDSRPVIQIITTNRDLEVQANLIEKVLRALWDETSWQDELARGIAMASVAGSNVGIATYDPQADYGRGDIRVRFFDPRAVWISKNVTRPTMLPDAEFVITQEMVPKATLVERFGERAMEVQPDANLSSLTEQTGRPRGLLSAAAGFFRRGSGQSKTVPGAIDYVFAKHYWFKDWQRYGDDEPMRGMPIYTRPRIIRHVIAAGGVVLLDEPNPFWHGAYPHEIFDWGMELEHTWGSSEVKQLRKAQEALNTIASDILKNAKLTNNFKVVSDTNALDAESYDQLSNRPAIIIRKRPGTQLEFVPPPSLPAYLFQLLQFLVSAIEMTAGLSEVNRGVPPSADSSGVAVECVDPETECLTKRGWKHYWELQTDDELYAMDPVTGAGVWSPLLRLNVQAHYDGPMYRFRSKTIDALVTPNHDWYVDTYRKPGVYRRINTRKLNAGHRIPATAALGEHYGLKIYSDSFIEFVGWLVTEGCYSTAITTKKNGRRYRYPQVKLCQSLTRNPELCERIEACLDRCGFTYWTRIDQRSQVKHWMLGLADSREIVRLFPDKRPGYDFIVSLPRKQLRILMEAMLLGDGRSFGLDRPHERVSIEFFSCDAELARQFQMIANLAGFGTSLRPARDHGHSFYRGRHRDVRYGECVRVTCREKPHSCVKNLLDQQTLTTEPYAGPIWCPTTTTGNFLARRNGRTYITGQSLQVAAQTVIRLQARRLEQFLTRLWSKCISLTFQYYTSDRVKTIVGPGGELDTFTFDRAALLLGLGPRDPREAFRDFIMHMVPGSTLSATKVQKAVLAGNLYRMGLIPGVEVLKTVEWHDPEGTFAKAQEEQIARAQAAAAAGNPGVAGLSALVGGRRQLQSFPAGGQPPLTFP